MSAEYDIEPIRGLPGNLPAGEHIIWQGTPSWFRLARDAFKTRWVAVYFIVLLLWAVVDGNASGAAMTLAVGLAAMALLHGLAWMTARATVYTITNRRVVLRYGVALPKCVNLPMSAIASAGFKRNSDGTGDIPLALSGDHRLGYVQFWPHARPWKVAAPEPMLRALPGVDNVAALLSGALLAAVPTGRRSIVTDVAETAAEPNGVLVAA
jgi:Bacterial PH domain